VIMHDVTLARTTDVEQVFPDRAPWNVRDFTLAEIKQLDAGSWFAPEFAGERVPTLVEWVGAVGDRAGMLLEPKAPELYPGIEIDLDKELRSLPVFNRALKRDRVVVQSFNHPWLRVYKDRAPDVTVGLLYGSRPTPVDIAAAATWAEQVNPALGAIDEATVDQIHAQGMEAHVWTVNAGQDMRRAINWDVDGIITNYPQVLRDILRRG
jgi:glycerophosphoryl diester phosphodiesterase